jgi:HD-GYP domain-containing protein (c-di-GMP phosphodiesterase class II)
VQETAAKAALTEEATNFLQSKLNVWLTKRGESSGFLRGSMQMPFGASGPAVTAAQLQRVFTAPVVAGLMRGLYLTVAFGAVPERTSHEMLAAALNQMQVAIEHSMNRSALQTIRMRIAEKLVEPDFMKVPALRRHTDLVAARAEGFARALGLQAAEVENVKLVAIVHDCGMRLLEYERLYMKKDLSPDELSMLREHVFVGAALVEPLLGTDVARAVLCHHERVDGRGYPNELHGDDIPYASRILQLCDAWVAMTDAESYQQRIETQESAIAIITRSAGSQFDAELARRFVDHVRSTRSSALTPTARA